MNGKENTLRRKPFDAQIKKERERKRKKEKDRGRKSEIDGEELQMRECNQKMENRGVLK